MKKSTLKKSKLLFTIAITFMFFSCSKKSVTHFEPKKEKSVKESLAEELLAEFQGDLESWNACIVYNGKEYTSLEDFRNRDK